MKGSILNSLLLDFYKFLFSKSDFSEFNDIVTGQFSFEKLISIFGKTVNSKIGKRNFLKILKQLLTIKEDVEINQNILVEMMQENDGFDDNKEYKISEVRAFMEHITKEIFIK